MATRNRKAITTGWMVLKPVVFLMGETTNLAGFQPSKVWMVQSYPDGKTT